MEKTELVEKLLAAKEASVLGLCNVYVAQIFHAQARLKKEVEKKLVKLMPGLKEDLLKHRRKCPMRSYDPKLIQELNVYRMTEVCMHYGEAIMNEKFGNGIMSVIK